MSRRGRLALSTVSARNWQGITPGFLDFTYEQSAAYAEAAAARLGAEARFLTIEQEGQIVAAAAVRIKRVPGLDRGIAYIPAGPLVHSPDAPEPGPERIANVLACLRRVLVAEERHILRLRFAAVPWFPMADPDALMAETGFRPTSRVRSYETFVVDLTRSEEALHTQLNPKWRADLRAAGRTDLALEIGTERSHSERFQALYNKVRALKGFDSDLAPEFFFRLVDPQFYRDVLIATHNGRDVAAIMLARTGRTAVYRYGATAEPGRRLRAGYFLTWNAMLYAKAQGMHWYDLGGIDPEADPDVFRFKKRIGAPRVRAVGPYEALPADPITFLVLRLESLRAKIRGHGVRGLLKRGAA